VHPGSTREKLIEAACSILSTESYSNLSIDHIAERAGFARRTFFLHFSSKDELLTAVLQEVRPIRLAKLEAWSEDRNPGYTFEQRICGYFDSIIDESSDRAWRGSLFIRLSAEFAELRGHPIHGIVAETYRDLAAWFEAEFRRHGYSSPSMRAEELIILLSGLLVRQLVDPSPLHGNAIRRMLPSVLASGQSDSPSTSHV
jgi:AcrR family transcriptional regulator